MNTKSRTELVKELHERTGVGIGKCKEALENSNLDINKAVEYLRKSGMATAVKKEGRESKEGIVLAAEDPKQVAIVEISAETDFVTRNDRFREFANNICLEILHTTPTTTADFLNQHFSKDKALTINEYRAGIVQSLGENIQIKRFKVFHKHPTTSFGVYSHMDGKIMCVVEIVGSAQATVLARDIAMHIAAEAPEYLSSNDIPSEVKEKEREIAMSQIKGKPPAIAEKIAEGKMQAFYNRVCLNNQHYVKDDSITIADLVKREEAKEGVKLTIKGFLRWKAGE